MKKILVFTVVLLIASVSVFASGQRENPFEGTWVKENGATISFKNKNFEFVDFENGVAGYGTFSLAEKGEKYIIFKNDYILDLKRSSVISIQNPKIFLELMLAEYQRLHPKETEALPKDQYYYATGNTFFKYTLIDNALIIKDTKENDDRAYTWPHYFILFFGEFIKQ